MTGAQSAPSRILELILLGISIYLEFSKSSSGSAKFKIPGAGQRPSAASSFECEAAPLTLSTQDHLKDLELLRGFAKPWSPDKCVSELE